MAGTCCPFYIIFVFPTINKTLFQIDALYLQQDIAYTTEIVQQQKNGKDQDSGWEDTLSSAQGIIPGLIFGGCLCVSRDPDGTL